MLPLANGMKFNHLELTQILQIFNVFNANNEFRSEFGMAHVITRNRNYCRKTSIRLNRLALQMKFMKYAVSFDLQCQGSLIFPHNGILIDSLDLS